jgi:hypothetical protein
MVVLEWFLIFFALVLLVVGLGPAGRAIFQWTSLMRRGALLVFFLSTLSVVGLAQTKRVIPQFADGRFQDGSYYTSTLQLLNGSEVTADCTVILNGVRPTITDSQGNLTVADAFTITLEPGGSEILGTTGAASFHSGYVTLECTSPVTSLVLYAYHDSTGTPMAQASTFSSTPETSLRFVVDQRSGARLGIAVNNDSNAKMALLVEAFDTMGQPVATRTLELTARTTLARFVDELLPLDAGFVGHVRFSSDGHSFTALGLRYQGSSFTSIPASAMTP